MQHFLWILKKHYKFQLSPPFDIFNLLSLLNQDTFFMDNKNPRFVTVKGFKNQRKNQLDAMKVKQAQTDALTTFIDTQNIEDFQKTFSEVKQQEIVYYLFSEDFMKVTPLMKILQCEDIEKWLSIVTSVVQKSWLSIDEKICKKWKENELIANDWKKKFAILNRRVIKLLLDLGEKDRSKTAEIIVKTFSSPHNFISELYHEYLTFDNVKQHFPLSIKANKNLLELASILEVFYIPLTKNMILGTQSKDFSRQFVNYRELLIKEYVWNTEDFIDAIKTNRINEYSFELKEIHHNFMHELFLQKDIKTIETVHQLLLHSQNQQHQKLLKKIYSSFRSDEETPIDIALQKWTFDSIQWLMRFIEQNPEIMKLTTNSLNLVLQNQCLGKVQKEQMIREILSEKFSHIGYIDSVKLDKHVEKKLSSSSSKSVLMQLTTNEFSSVIVYDTEKLISKKYRKTYPLLSYLDQFREKSDLQIVERLFLKSLLDRKPSKLKIVSTIKLFWKKKKSPIQQNSSGHKQIEELIYYHTPLMYLVARMAPCECSQYLIDKMFLNCPEIFFKKLDGSLELEVGRHFLIIYLESCQSLSENSQNNAILEKIFMSKQSERFIGSNYNFYIELLKDLNKSNVFMQSKNEFYMTRQIRFYLRQYFDIFQAQQLFKSDYFTELSWEFFSIKLNKKSKVMEKYTIGKDWGLYDADELCKKLSKINLKKYLQSNAQQNQEQGADPTKKSHIQKLAQILLNFQKGIEFQEEEQIEQLPYPDFVDSSVFWFKTRYHQYKSYNSLKKFIGKIKFDQQKLNANETPPEILTSSIEITITEKHLQQKISLLIKQGFDFHICKKQAKLFEEQKDQLSYEKYLNEKQMWRMIEILRAQIKEEKLQNIIYRMILRKLSFMKELLYCHEGEEDDLDYLWENKDREYFSCKMMKYVDWRGYQSPRLPHKSCYPQQPIEPIPIHTFIKLYELSRNQNFKTIQRKLQPKYILLNFFMNLNSILMQFEHIQNSKFKQHYIQEEKREKTKEFVLYWEKWHSYIKDFFKITQNMHKFVQKLKQHQQNTTNQEESLQDPLETYYVMTGTELLLKYHSSRLDLSQILIKLSVEEVFVIDCLTKVENESNFIMVYKMQAEQKPCDVFMQRMNIAPITKPLQNSKQHNNIQQIFIAQLQKMTLQEFQSVIQRMKECFLVPLWDIFKNIQNEKKLIYLLEYVLQSTNPEDHKKFTPQYIISLIKEDKPQLTMIILLLVQKNQFKFFINQMVKNRTKRLSTDNISFYHQCQFDTFKKIVQLAQKYYVRNSKCVSEKVIEMKIKKIVRSLVGAQRWERLQLLLEMKGFNYIQTVVKCSFQEIGSSLSSVKRSLQNENQIKTFAWIIDKLFKLYKQLFVPFQETVFINSFLCDPQKSFEVMNPHELKIQAFVTCLKAHPQEAKKFLTHEVAINTENKPDRGYFQHVFPLTPYYYDKFGNNPWMLDLLRVQRKILTAFDQLKRVDKTMQSLILLDKMDANFDEFYTEQEIELKCSKLLSSNTVTSIKKYPQTWFDSYFAKHQLKNLSILTKQLLRELIDMGYVKKEHVFKIISTCKLEVIKYFFEKHKITLNLQTIQQIQTTILEQKYKSSFWQFLSSIQNQQFVIDFIKQYNLFEVCPVESYDNIILTNIAIHKSINLLRFLLQHLTSKAGRQLEFVFDKLGKIQNYLVTFPQEISVTMNFYEYYFLVKQSHNQCPDFYVSSRFLISNDNFEKQIQSYNFIPQMKRRLQILNVLCNVPSVNRDISWKSGILLKQIFNLNVNLENSIEISSNLQSKNNWTNFIKYLVDQDPEVFHYENIGQLTSVLILYLGTAKTKISVDQIGKLYPKQIEIIKKVDKFLKKDVNVSEFAFNIIKTDPRLKALLLADNFDLFMENFQNELSLISTFDDALLYMEGIIVNLKTFEVEEKYRKYLEKFLDLCFTSQNGSYLKSTTYSLYLKKKILSLLIISFCEGNRFTFDRLSKTYELQNLKPGYILFIAAKKANEVSVRGSLSPSFDIRCWNSVIEEISHLKFPLTQDNKNFDLNQLVEDSLQSLEIQLRMYFQMKVKNLREIIDQSVQKVQQKQKSNIFHLITVLINETYVFSNCAQLYRSLLDTKIVLESRQPSIESESLNRIVINVTENSSEKIFVIFDPEKFELNLFPEKIEKMQLTIPHSWTTVQSDLPLIHFDVVDTLSRAQKQILIHKLTVNPNIEVLNKIYENLDQSSFKKMKFKFDLESLKKVKKGESLRKIVEYLPMTDNSIYQIQNILGQIDQKVFNDKSIRYYSLSDVSGPIKLSQEESYQKIIDCISFYELLQLPSKEVIVEVIEVKPSESQITEKCVDDFFTYIDYIMNEVKDTHLDSYKFSNKIQLFIDEQTLQISTFMHCFSLMNILKCLSSVNGSSDQRRRIFENQIDIRYDVVSVIKIYQWARERSIKLNKSENFFTFLQAFLRCQQTKKLIDKILLLIIQDAINIMKILKGALISFSINKHKLQNFPNLIRKKYWLNQYTSVNLITYQIQNQILRIMIDVETLRQKQTQEQMKAIGVQETGLVSRINFLESIFSSTEFLTDYFLSKSLLDSECVKVSRSLSQKLNVMLNVHINYKSLYGFIDSIKKDVPIKQIDTNLYALRMYLMVNLETRLLEHFTSTQIQETHLVLLKNTFQVLHNQLQQGNDKILAQQNLQKAIDEFGNGKIFCCECKKDVKDVKSLQLLEGYGQKVDNFNDFAKNVFLIQIFKNYFTTLVSQGMTFVIGFRESNRPPAMVKFIKQQDIDRININEVSYMLLVSQTIPTNDELDHKKIIKIFVTDMYKNVYKVSEIVKDCLLGLEGDDEELRNINNLVPVIPKNIVVDFDNVNKLIAPHLKVSPRRGLKIFEIKLTKQPKFKLTPTKQPPMELTNYLMKHVQLNKQLDRFKQKMRTQWQSTFFQIIIDCFSMRMTNINYQKVAQTLKNYLIDFEAALECYLQNAPTNPELDYIASVWYGAGIERNITVLNRKATFLKYFPYVRFFLTDTKHPKVTVVEDEIRVELSVDAQNYLKPKQILQDILKAQLERELRPRNIYEQYYEIQIEHQQKLYLSVNQRIKCIDIINIVEAQREEIQKALNVFFRINNNYKKIPALVTFVLTKDMKTCIKHTDQRGGYFDVYFNIQSDQCEFFTSSQVLMIMLNDYCEKKKEAHFVGQYDHQNKNIQVHGAIKNEYLLVVDNNDYFLDFCQKEVYRKNQTIGVIPIPQIIDRLDPQKKSYQFWLIDLEGKQVYDNFIYFIDQKESKYVHQKLTSVGIGQQYHLIVKQTKESEMLNVDKLSITMSILEPNDNSPRSYQSILSEDNLKYMKMRMISREAVNMTFSFDKAFNVSINLGTFRNILDTSSNRDTYQIVVSSKQQAVIENTRFVEVHFRNKIYQCKGIKQNDKKQTYHKKFFVEPAEKEVIMEESEGIQQKTKKSNDIESLVYVVNNESTNQLTRAGEKRVDYIQVCDAGFNPIEYKGEVNIYFKHINNLCKIVPEVERKGTKIGLAWTPTIRGHYNVYFNGICLSPDYEIGVCAAVVDPRITTVLKPKVNKICFYEETQCTFNLKDSFGNIYTELQEDILGDGLMIDIESDKQEISKFMKKKQEPINKYGAKKVRFSIENVGIILQSIRTVFSVYLNKQKISEFQILIEGESLQQRRKNLTNSLDILRKGFSKDITVSRSNFLEDLFKIAEKSLLTNFYVKFSGEMGIDAGGLKRQFYDLIGNEIKSDKNPFFKPTDSRKIFYFINPQVLKNKKKQEYMELFGKYLANSILNGYLIGVNFSPVFIKLLYNDPIEFEDLLEIMPEDEARTYKYLTTAQPDEFEDLEIYFTTIINKKKGLQVQLKENGTNIQVTHQNVKEYLDLLTQVLVKKRYEEVVDAFRKGFESVVSMDVVKKSIRANEFWCLTQGIKDLNAQMVLNYVNFTGKADQSICNWFRRYINESSKEVLEGFLKFASGSSSIDFDQTSKIAVTFQNAGQNTKKLPISHTCWKQIVIPKYKSYEIMHKLLDAAFIYCCEGFGFG